MLRIRFSNARIMIIVAIVAVDCALLRVTSTGGRDDGSMAQATSLLIMSNILALGFFRILARRGERHPFLTGFVGSGLVGMLIYLGCCYNTSVRQAQQAVQGSCASLISYLPRHILMDSGRRGNPLARMLLFVILIGIPAMVFTLGQLFVALITAILYSKYIVARRGSDEGSRQGEVTDT